MLQSLSNLPCEYRWTTRAIFLDPIDADKQIEKYRKSWGQKVRGFVDQLMGKHSDNINYDAATMKEDAQIAKGENNSNTVRYLYLTPTIVIMDEDIDRLDETTNLIRTTIKMSSILMQELRQLMQWMPTLAVCRHIPMRM